MMLQKEIIRETGGSFGIRDEGLLESAIAAPYQSFGDTEFFLQSCLNGSKSICHKDSDVSVEKTEPWDNLRFCFIHTKKLWIVPPGT